MEVLYINFLVLILLNTILFVIFCREMSTSSIEILCNGPRPKLPCILEMYLRKVIRNVLPRGKEI